MTNETLKNLIKNRIFDSDKAVFPFKNEGIDYLTRDNSIFIMGQLSAREAIMKLIDEVFNEL